MYIDLHCDTVIKYIENRNPYDLMYGEKSDINLNKLIESKVKAQFMAIYLYNYDYDDAPNLGKIDDWKYIDKCINYINDTEKEYSNNIKVVKNYSDYINTKKEGKTSLFITIEDGRCIEKIEDIGKLKNRGISLITLLWNYKNKIGFPSSSNKEESNKGLSKFGFEVIEEMNNKGIIIDVSHISDGGFWDIYKHSKVPFIASHSNSRKIQNHPRNLDDKQIKALSERGGIVGFNVFPNFTNGKNSASFDDYLRHVEYIAKIGGEEVISWGTDFDGINGEYSINSPRKVLEFMNYLNVNKFKSSFIDKMLYKNAERFLKEFNWG